MNQSKLEANTCKWCLKVQENMHEQITVGFDFTSDWLRNGTTFLPSHIEAYYCNTKWKFLNTLIEKPLYLELVTIYFKI